MWKFALFIQYLVPIPVWGKPLDGRVHDGLPHKPGHQVQDHEDGQGVQEGAGLEELQGGHDGLGGSERQVAGAQLVLDVGQLVLQPPPLLLAPGQVAVTVLNKTRKYF